MLFLPIDRSQFVKVEDLYNDLLDHMRHLFHIGYEALSRYVDIAYYPSSNRNTGHNNCSRYPAIKKRSIDDLTISESREMTGLSINQLKKLFRHLRIPPLLIWKRRYTFTGEEAFLHFMLYLRTGDTKLRMSTSHFWW